jgi:hypothetical protein
MSSAGGCPSWQAMVSVKNFHRSARALPATCRHAGHVTRCYDTAGHSPTSRLCRVPDLRILSMATDISHGTRTRAIHAKHQKRRPGHAAAGTDNPASHRLPMARLAQEVRPGVCRTLAEAVSAISRIAVTRYQHRARTRPSGRRGLLVRSPPLMKTATCLNTSRRDPAHCRPDRLEAYSVEISKFAHADRRCFTFQHLI